MFYWFLLWREFKLSIAEICSVFPISNIVFLDKNILILDGNVEEDILNKANFLWWTIKIIKFEKLDTKDDLQEIILNIANKKYWKFQYGLSIYPEGILKTTLSSLKKYLVSNSISSRFVNKDFKNLSSSQIIWEKLVSKWTDFTFISSKNNFYFWITIWIQDIESYSKRDYDKERDMHVWMLPPKLSQMMINISKKTYKDNIIYDPFCWLWTVLIEWVFMWYNKVYWSDLSEKMVEVTSKNLKSLWKENIFLDIFKLNAKYIDEAEIFSKNKDFSIVTEWYLWEIMTKSNITIDRIEKQRESLTKIYEAFFLWLKKQSYIWNIVISFPFWEINSKYHYFEEIYEIIQKYCEILDLLPKWGEFGVTKSWSLLYKRDNQIVWREIFKLKIKG